MNVVCFHAADTKFVSATNVAHAGKRGNICVGNNVSSFARAFGKGDVLTCSRLSITGEDRKSGRTTSGVFFSPRPRSSPTRFFDPLK